MTTTHKLSILPSIILGAVISLTLFSIFASVVFAQSNELEDKAVKCLNSRNGKQVESVGFSDDGGNHLGRYVNRLLTGEFSTAAKAVYPVACEKSATGRKCTTGNNAMDIEALGGLDTKEDMSVGKIQVSFSDPGTRQPAIKRTVGEGGKIDVDAKLLEMRNGEGVEPKQLVKNPVGGSVEFFGVEILPHVDEITTTIDPGGLGALQQATFLFDDENITSSAKGCAVISWVWYDPYGIAFDSISLEPISGVEVTIRDEAGVRIPDSPVMRNEGSTRYDGVYNYLVQPGKYLLTVSPPPGYQFSPNPKSSPHMLEVYDFIDENNAKSHCSIYQPSEIIDEKAGYPECRNIPLEPVSVVPLSKEPIKIEYEYLPDSIKGVHVLKGKVSHPLTTVVAYQKISSAQRVELASTESNHSGFFSLHIPIERILASVPLDIEFQKSTLMGIKTQGQETQKSTLQLDPLPTYVEGYAFDEQQRIIPNALVQVKLKNGNNNYYEMRTDENGYFFIPSKNLPTFLNLEYYLTFTKQTGEKVPYKMHEFTKANHYYFTKEGINLLTGLKNGKPATPQAASKTKLGLVPLSLNNQASIKKGNTNIQTPDNANEEIKQADATQNKSYLQILLIIGMLVYLVIVVIIVAVSVAKKKDPIQ